MFPSVCEKSGCILKFAHFLAKWAALMNSVIFPSDMLCVSTRACFIVHVLDVCVLPGLQVHSSALALFPSPVELSIMCRVPCSICSK